MSSVESIMDTPKFCEWIGLQTDVSKQCFNKQVSEWETDENKLKSLSSKFNTFKGIIQKDPSFLKECKDVFNNIAKCEKEINNLVNTDSKLEKESYNEILFFRPILQPLNFIPFVLSLWAFIRIYLLPGISFIIPFLTLLAPYIVLKFAFNIPITIKSYMNILHSMVTGNFGKMMDPTSVNTTTFNISPANFIKQFGIVIVTFIQGIIQPYWSYKHLKSIDTIINDKGKIVMQFKDLYIQLHTILKKRGCDFFNCPLPDIINERDATARVILNASYFKLALKYIGQIEVLICLAGTNDINPVKWIKNKTPVFRIKDTFDFQVLEENRKKTSVNFTSKRHALLTGPNKGGKSTVLRALSISALLAHTYGCSPGYLTLTPFYKLFVCLKPDDLPGEKSRFEREIEFTANTLIYTKPILIFIDELYHSTNPPDALRSCRIYCEQLWNKDNIISVISTHLFKLVETSSKNIQRICCNAHIDENNDIVFEYTLSNGICKVSSVDELLKKNGLLKNNASEMDTKIPIARQNDNNE
jgi:hypothetical protein